MGWIFALCVALLIGLMFLMVYDPPGCHHEKTGRTIYIMTGKVLVPTDETTLVCDATPGAK